MANGFVMLGREIFEPEFFENHEMVIAYLWCVSRASYKDRQIVVGREVIDIKKGQFVTGRRSAASELNFSESVTWKLLKNLHKLGKITLNSSKKYTIVTLEQQEFEKTEEPNYNHNATTDEPQTNQTETTNEPKRDTNKERNIEKRNTEKRNTETHTQLDPRVESVKCVFEQRYGLLNYSVVEDITMLINSGMQEDVIIKALSLANKGYSANYALKICKNWLSDGVRTMQDYEVKEGANYGNDSRNARNNAVTKDDELPPIQKSEAELRYEAYELTDYVEEDLPF